MPPSSLLERIACWPSAEAATIVFGFAWGAMLGSFINVVVHRLPAGESVVTRRSRCPRCRAAIRPRDNLPVVGWLVLRGRCRECGGAISAEYPLVEAGCGLAAALLAAAELVGGGQWLPRMEDGMPAGIDRLLRGDWRLLAAWALHTGVVLTIVCWGLLDRRGWRVPTRAVVAPLLAVVMVAAGAPPAGPPGLVPGGADWPTGPPWLGATAAVAAGALAGGLWGRAAPGAGIRLGLPLAGSIVGWQAVTILSVVTGAIGRCPACRGGGRKWSTGLVLAAVTTVWLAFHGLFHGFLGPPAAGRPW